MGYNYIRMEGYQNDIKIFNNTKARIAYKNNVIIKNHLKPIKQEHDNFNKCDIYQLKFSDCPKK